MVLLIGAACLASAQTTVIMNEIYSRGVAGNLDWIEVYNPTSSPINISGYRIYDIGGQGLTKPKKPFPVGTIVPAKGFYVIVTDTADSIEPSSGFGLSSGGEKVWLEDTTTHTIVDTCTFGVMSTAQTWGRGPDGGAWALLNTITRGTSNGAIVMNEIYSRGVAGNLDWIEVYNSVSAPVNISGYRIYDIGGQGLTKPKKPFPAGTILPANGFYVIVTDTADSIEPSSGFGLSSGGEKVWLEDTTRATIVDTCTFGVMSTTQTWGRYPDGGPWQLLNTITRGATNNTAVGVTDEPLIADDYRLAQNYPNPFNPATVITYQVPVVSRQSSVVSLKVYDLLGREVATLVNEAKQPGTYQVRFDGSRLTSGVYVYRLSTGSVQETRRMVLVK
jgi:hypothetical protein